MDVTIEDLAKRIEQLETTQLVLFKILSVCIGRDGLVEEVVKTLINEKEFSDMSPEIKETLLKLSGS